MRSLAAVFQPLLARGNYELRLYFELPFFIGTFVKGVLLELDSLVDVWQLALIRLVEPALQVVNLLLNVTLLLSLTLQHFRYELQLT